MVDPALCPNVLDEPVEDTKAIRVRKGNIRARLRMITLYNLAQLHGGFVASTDNLSELGAGFWTLHGDVGDYSPIQSLLKSWEVPYLAQLNGVPESTVRAKPTDGLGIDSGDEAQLGASYLEWDLMTYALHQGMAVRDADQPEIVRFYDPAKFEFRTTPSVRSPVSATLPQRSTTSVPNRCSPLSRAAWVQLGSSGRTRSTSRTRSKPLRTHRQHRPRTLRSGMLQGHAAARTPRRRA
jgi:hypothetical protein